MVFRRSRYAPRQTDKHEIAWSNLIEDASSIQSETLIQVVQPASKNVGTECAIGSRVYGVYIEFNLSANVVTNPKIVHWTVEMFRTGETLAVTSLYYQSSRSRILKRGMEMLPKDLGTQIKRIFFVPLPKGRLQENVNLAFRYIATSAEAINMCGFAIYKEIY